MKLRAILISSSAVVLSSCGNLQSMLAPGGPAADNLAHLGWFVFVLFLVIAVIMWGLIAWVSLRRRGSFQHHQPVDAGGGQNWILIGGFAIPFVILAVVFVSGLKGMSVFPLHGHAGTPPDIRVTGHQWWWQIEYVKGPAHERFITASEIHIPVGQPVDIDLTSIDVIHSFFVPRLHGKVDLIPGQMNRIRIQASTAGVYRGQCAEYCGAQHAHMILYVVADPPEAYQRWRTTQMQEAPEPASDQEKRGQALFLERPCATCHTVRGTMAGGRVGPDLTHFGSRLGLASNAYWNNDANLSAWVTHAQALKPDVVMPNITQFRGNELHDIVAYLRQLR